MVNLRYTIDARDGRQHRFRVSLELSVSDHFGGVELFMPVWTPGSYLIREHQRHVGDVQATDPATGSAVAWHKTRKNRYRFEVGNRQQRLRVTYSVFAHELTVRTADLTPEHAFWNNGCLCLWPVDQREASATVDVLLPRGWRLWTWLPTRDIADGQQFAVVGLDQLADCPMLAAGDVRVLEFDVLGRPHRFVFEGLGGVEPPTNLVRDTQAVVAEAAKVFGLSELPYERYDFVTLVTDKGQGGLEHADGTVLLTPRTALATGKGYRDFLGLVAHEHFHVFNVKRMRPAELWQLDYESENLTRLLWVAEGFTAYYDDLICHRAGALSPERYLQVVADNIGDALRTPGRLVHPLADASFDAWIKFYRPDEDTKNSSQSYYVNGGLAAMCMDLEICRRSRGTRNLDDAMRWLWRKTYESGRGFTRDDVVAAVSHAADADLSGFVANLVEGPFQPDFGSLLGPLGLSLQPVAAGAEAPPAFGMQFQPGGTTVASVFRDGAAAVAGITAGDEILAVGGLRVSAGTFEDVVRAVCSVGREVDVLLARRGLVSVAKVKPETPSERPNFKISVVDHPTTEQTQARRAWLRSDPT